jgi:hypothetical protein
MVVQGEYGRVFRFLVLKMLNSPLTSPLRLHLHELLKLERDRIDGDGEELHLQKKIEHSSHIAVFSALAPSATPTPPFVTKRPSEKLSTPTL